METKMVFFFNRGLLICLVVMTVLVMGCRGECDDDSDCPEDQRCSSSGGLFFGKDVCVAEGGSDNLLPDAGSLGTDTGGDDPGIPDVEDADLGLADADAEDLDAHAGSDDAGAPDVGDADTGEATTQEPLEVLVMFLDTNFTFPTPVDIELNGERFEFWGRDMDHPDWDSTLHDARGQVVTLDGPLETVAFDYDQIHVEGLNNHGFGHFNYVLQRRHPDTNLQGLTTGTGGINDWDQSDELQLQMLRNGYNNTFDPNPTFYELTVTEEWSQTQKMVIFVGGRGNNHPSFGPDEHPDPDPEPTDPDPTDPDPTDPDPTDPDPTDPDGPPQFEDSGPVEVPSGDPMQVLVMFLDTNFEFTTPVDVRLNNTWYQFQGTESDDPMWNSSLGNARGRVITIDDPLVRVEFNPEQLYFPELNNHGFGFFQYKVMQTHPDGDLYNLNNDVGSLSYWADSHNGAGILWLRSGFNATLQPNPTFYIFDVPAQYTQSGKIKVVIGGHGRHHPSFPEDWHP